jgi:MFS family permease
MWILDEWRPSAVTRGAPILPLLVLLGLNTVDELDRSAFAVLLPDIRDHFGLSDAGALGLVALTTVAILLIEVPLGFYADRRNRVRIAATGAALWTVFSVGTGAATSVAMLAVARMGAGGGRAVVTPTHSSLLSDWYEPSARVKVFGAHRLASSTATSAPRLDPIRTVGAGGRLRIACCSCDIIRVTVSVSKSGPFRSGQCRVMPCCASRRSKNCALVDAGEEAKPCK